MDLNDDKNYTLIKCLGYENAFGHTDNGFFKKGHIIFRLYYYSYVVSAAPYAQQWTLSLSHEGESIHATTGAQGAKQHPHANIIHILISIYNAFFVWYLLSYLLCK